MCSLNPKCECASGCAAFIGMQDVFRVEESNPDTPQTAWCYHQLGKLLSSSLEDKPLGTGQGTVADAPSTHTNQTYLIKLLDSVRHVWTISSTGFLQHSSNAATECEIWSSLISSTHNVIYNYSFLSTEQSFLFGPFLQTEVKQSSLCVLHAFSIRFYLYLGPLSFQKPHPHSSFNLLTNVLRCCFRVSTVFCFVKCISPSCRLAAPHAASCVTFRMVFWGPQVPPFSSRHDHDHYNQTVQFKSPDIKMFVSVFSSNLAFFSFF